MNFKSTILIFILVVFNTTIALSQDNSASHKINIEIPEVALLGLVSNGSTNINFHSASPVEAGNSIDFSNAKQTKNLWINYSSIIRDNNHRRKIVAFIQGKTPVGIHLKVEASEAAGSGKGKLGTSSGTVSLSDQPSEIITDIGSCYTGKGTSNGHYLTYKLEYDDSADNYAQLALSETSFNVVYTLTDLN